MKNRRGKNHPFYGKFGKDHPMFGKKNPKVSEIMSSNKNPMKKEYNRKMLRERMIGDKNPMFGKPHPK